MCNFTAQWLKLGVCRWIIWPDAHLIILNRRNSDKCAAHWRLLHRSGLLSQSGYKWQLVHFAEETCRLSAVWGHFHLAGGASWGHELSSIVLPACGYLSLNIIIHCDSHLPAAQPPSLCEWCGCDYNCHRPEPLLCSISWLSVHFNQCYTCWKKAPSRHFWSAWCVSVWVEHLQHVRDMLLYGVYNDLHIPDAILTVLSGTWVSVFSSLFLEFQPKYKQMSVSLFYFLPPSVVSPISHFLIMEFLRVSFLTLYYNEMNKFLQTVHHSNELC